MGVLSITRPGGSDGDSGADSDGRGPGHRRARPNGRSGGGNDNLPYEGDGDGDPPGPARGHPSLLATDSIGSRPCEGHGHAANLAARKQALRLCEERVKLMREWLQACLQVHQYVTVRIQSDEEGAPDTLQPMQILAVEPKPVFVRTYEDKMAPPVEFNLLMKVTVQKLQVWEPSIATQTAFNANDFDCFVLEDPHNVDVMSMCGSTPEDRDRWRCWSVDDSTIDGCIRFHTPQPLAVTMDITKKHFPVLALHDLLHSGGWSPEPALRTHGGPRSAKRYDSRKPLEKTFLLQMPPGLVAPFQRGRQKVRQPAKSGVLSAFVEETERSYDGTESSRICGRTPRDTSSIRRVGRGRKSRGSGSRHQGQEEKPCHTWRRLERR